MPEHYPENVQRVMVFCPTCNKRTMHRTDHHRLGSCTEHAPEGLSEKQKRAREKQAEEDQQPGLF
jgi:hypothetical protein